MQGHQFNSRYPKKKKNPKQTNDDAPNNDKLHFTLYVHKTFPKFILSWVKTSLNNFQRTKVIPSTLSNHTSVME